MKLFKKLAVNMHSQVEAVANQFENKEALSASYIREYERIVAKAKVKLAQVTDEVVRLEKESRRLAGQAARWRDRARQVHAEDEDQALECVRRMQRMEADRSDRQAELDETRELQRQMARDLDAAHRKLGNLRRRHRLLAGRQTCADARDVLAPGDGSLPEDLDALYTRWETDVTAREIHVGTARPESDPLAAAFDRREAEADLRRTLAKIVSPSNAVKE